MVGDLDGANPDRMDLDPHQAWYHHPRTVPTTDVDGISFHVNAIDYRHNFAELVIQMFANAWLADLRRWFKNNGRTRWQLG